MRNRIFEFFRKVFETVYYHTRKVGNGYVSGYVRGIRNVAMEGENQIVNGCNFQGDIKLGYRTTLGVNNWLHGTITIGKYCQIGADVAIHTNNHPVTYLSTYVGSSLFEGYLNHNKTFGKVTIGHDVWIGHNALILGNVNIGNGAVIAAGAVVTKDVEPYTVVAGVPAKPLKKRFSENIIREIEDLKWWDKTDEEIKAIKPLFFKDLSKVDSLYQDVSKDSE